MNLSFPQCIIKDARHDSSRAAMHSTVSAISMRSELRDICLVYQNNVLFY